MSKQSPTAEKRPQSFLRASNTKNVMLIEGFIYTNLGQDYGVVKMSEEDHSLFLKDYSRHYGPALDQEQMAIRWGFPSAHAVAEFVRIHGIRHTSLPFTDGELEVKGVASSIDQAVIQRRQDYLEGYQRKVNVQLRTDAAKYNMLETALADAVEALNQGIRHHAVLDLKTPERPFLAVVGTTDIHYGKVTFDHAGKEDYNPAIAAERAVAATQELLGKIAAQGKPKRLYFMVGSDNLHIDTPGKTTTKATPLAVSTASGSFSSLLAGYVALQETLIGLALQLDCPLSLVILPGNHDQAVSIMLGLMLKRLYANNPLVRFVDEPDEPVQFDFCGEVTLAFNHGEQVKEKTLHREFVTAARTRGVPLGRALVMFSGHLHHLKIQDCDGVDWVQFPAPCGHDEWHKAGGYGHARPGATAVTYTLSGQLQDTHHVRP